MIAPPIQSMKSNRRKSISAARTKSMGKERKVIPRKKPLASQKTDKPSSRIPTVRPESAAIENNFKKNFTFTPSDLTSKERKKRTSTKK